MQDRLTALCLECAARQPPAATCLACGAPQVRDLTLPTRDDTLRRCEQRMRVRLRRELARATPAARSAVVTFSLGGALASLALWGPALVVAPSLGAAVLGATVGTSAAVGAALRHFAPSWLAGRTLRDEMAMQVDVLVRTTPRRIAMPPMRAGEDIATLHGVVDATARPSPFGRSALAVRVVGELASQPVDDAWVAGEQWSLAGALGTEPVALDLTDGVVLDGPATTELTLGRDDAEMRSFFAPRALDANGPARNLRIATLAPGVRVSVTGRLVERRVSDGYRDTKPAHTLRGPLEVRWGDEDD